MSIRVPRKYFKPFEYPEVVQYKEAINKSYWLESAINFESDVQDFHLLIPKEKTVASRSMLGVSQVEIGLKKFWANAADAFPKPEIVQVCITFAESEIRHADAYSRLIGLVGLNNEFEQLENVPAIRGRVDYLTKYLTVPKDYDIKEYARVLTLFSLFIENVSLFSQFLILKSFSKAKKGAMKSIDNAISATAREEVIHASFGVWLINQLRKESPELFDQVFWENIKVACMKSYTAEKNIIDWIFEDGDLEFISKDVVDEFIKDRFNSSLSMIGGEKIFQIDEEKITKTRWFIEEVMGEESMDFFAHHVSNYTKFTKSYTEDDLF